LGAAVPRERPWEHRNRSPAARLPGSEIRRRCTVSILEINPMNRMWTGLCVALLGALLMALGAPAAQAAKDTLVIALNQDPDILDPTLSRTYVGRIIYVNMCEKLYDIDEHLNIHPQLAADFPRFSNGGKVVTIRLRKGVKFNDGTPMDAEAVKFSLDRHRSFAGSNRKSELKQITKVEALDRYTVRIELSEPFSPIVGAFVDRSGMPVSPAQARKLGDKFGNDPICVGPWTFSERVPQDRIVLTKSKYYFNPKAAHFKTLIFRIIPDDSVRLANLRSGDIDLMHLVSPTDATSLKKEGKFQVAGVTGIGYQGMDINIHNKTGKHEAQGDLGTPLANDPRVREALELSIDRDALNQVAWDGQYTPGCTPLSPISPFFDKSAKCPKRDVAKAKALLAEAGVQTPYKFELMTINNPQQQRVAETIQSMASEAGFQISLHPTEFAASLKDADAGKFEAYLIGWSGRVDPDADIYQFNTCGGSLNEENVCDKNIDALLDKARQVSGLKERKKLYDEAIAALQKRRNIIYLYHLNYIVAFPPNLKGYKGTSDGLIRLKGVSWQG
jgi:peptide/nickel transport system substrate-binding protein